MTTTGRRRVLRALGFHPVDRAPRDFWIAPATEAFRPDEVAELTFRYQSDIVRPAFTYPKGERSKGKPGRTGQYTDPWGCTFEVSEPGTRGQLVEPAVPTVSAISDYSPPLEILKKADLSEVNQFCQSCSQFVLAATETYLADRLCWLRGENTALGELKRGSKNLHKLLEIVDQFCTQDVELWCQSEVDGLIIGDTLLGQPEAIPPEIWQEWFKPLYHKYCQKIRESDKFVFFRSSGDVLPYLADLAEIGVDAVWVNLDVTPVEKVAEQFRGKIALWATLDDEQSFRTKEIEQLREKVRHIRRVLNDRQGGVISLCYWGPELPLKNVAVFLEQWLEPLTADQVPQQQQETTSPSESKSEDNQENT